MGRYVYVTNPDEGTVSALAIDAVTGELSIVPGSPFASGREPAWIAADPSGQFLYVVNSADNTVAVFEIDAATGALAPVAGSPFAVGVQPTSIAISK